MKNHIKTWKAISCVAAVGFFLGTPAHAGLFFWDNGGAGSDYGTPGNWNPDGTPGNADLAVHNSSLPAIQITANGTADSLRLSDGGTVNQTGGTFTIANGFAGDNGLWVGEFGPVATSYTMSGGTLQINDPNDGFMIGRNGGSVGTFTLNSGVVNNTVGDTHIGLDGRATWNQSGGTFNGAGVQIGRFASPLATVSLSGNANWNVGLVLMADGHGVFNPRNPGPVNFNIIGPGVTLSTGGLVMQDEGTLTFDGTGGGVSAMNLNGGIFLLNNGKLFLNNLPTPVGLGQTITLLDNMGASIGSDSQFDNAANGTLYGGWQLDYTGTQIRLVSVVPEPTSLALMSLGALVLLGRRQQRKA